MTSVDNKRRCKEVILMGIFTKLFGGAEGIREAMRESYEKHYKLAQVHEFPGLSPHEAGLLGAL